MLSLTHIEAFRGSILSTMPGNRVVGQAVIKQILTKAKDNSSRCFFSSSYISASINISQSPCHIIRTNSLSTVCTCTFFVVFWVNLVFHSTNRHHGVGLKQSLRASNSYLMNLRLFEGKYCLKKSQSSPEYFLYRSNALSNVSH